MKKIIGLLLFAFIVCSGINAQRQFKHPGLSYTQADIDRMRAMIKAQKEPFYSTFIEFKESRYTTYRDYDRALPTCQGEPVIWTNFNLWLDDFGNVAFNNALMWKLTDDKTYADKAVATLNRYIPVHSTVPYGTNCLDNSKAYMLIEAAELLRDYEGWSEEDQQGFKDFLVYPGYSSKEDYYEKYHSSDTLKNQITIYWNIFQGDPGRHGNQGLYGLRALLAMGVYLDNDTIYDRAYRKFMSLPHRPDDLPYPKGPKIPGNSSDHINSEYFIKYNTSEITVGNDDDYGYDDELKHWIWENGQCQEASRDQGHIMDGMCNLIDIARIAWNQGDDLFSAYDGRILKGLNYAARYNYGWYNKHTKDNAYWYEEELFEPTIENGQFIRRLARCARWESLKINPWSEGNQTTWSRGKLFYNPSTMLTFYKVRLNMPADSIIWIQRAYDIKCQEDGTTPGGLLDHRKEWMAGDGGRFSDKKHISGLHVMPGTIQAADYDFYNYMTSGEGHTFHNEGNVIDSIYRNEGTVEIIRDGNDYVIDRIKDGEWQHYSFSIKSMGIYTISVECSTEQENASFSVSVDNGKIISKTLPVTSGYQNINIGTLVLQPGAQVLRITYNGPDDIVKLRSIKVTKGKVSALPVNYENTNSNETDNTMYRIDGVKANNIEGNISTHSGLFIGKGKKTIILPR